MHVATRVVAPGRRRAIRRHLANFSAKPVVGQQSCEADLIGERHHAAAAVVAGLRGRAVGKDRGDKPVAGVIHIPRHAAHGIRLEHPIAGGVVGDKRVGAVGGNAFQLSLLRVEDGTRRSAVAIHRRREATGGVVLEACHRRGQRPTAVGVGRGLRSLATERVVCADCHLAVAISDRDHFAPGVVGERLHHHHPGSRFRGAGEHLPGCVVGEARRPTQRRGGQLHEPAAADDSRETCRGVEPIEAGVFDPGREESA